jgi:predicted acyltransferase
MTLVDCKGPDSPWIIRHAQWNGVAPADFVFPSFLFILGMAVPLSLSKNKPIRLRSFIRIIGLFLIGIILNLIDEKFEWRN